MWKMWKTGFDAWERTTASYLDGMLRNKAMLQPAGAMLTAVMKTKAATDRAVAAWWGAVGLPTKRDQERSLHRINQLESRVLDLQEQLEDALEREPKETP